MLGRLYRKRLGNLVGPAGLFVLIFIAPLQAVAEIVSLPMTFDFQLLQRLIITQAYRDPGENAVIVAMNRGCNEIRLNRPQIQEDNGFIRFRTNISIAWGTPVGGSCFAPLYWSGAVALRQQPIIDRHWQLRFKTHDSILLDSSGNRAPLSGLIWDLVKTNVHSYLDGIVLNLAPPVDNLKQFIAPQAAHRPLDAAARFLADMHPGIPEVRSNGLSINILAEADIPQTRPDNGAVEPLDSPAQQEQLMNLWQTWDALLVHMIGQIAGRELSDDDRRLLLDTLLRVRYEFSEVIGTPALTTGFVRHQFIASWQALKSLFRNHLTPDPSGNLLGYLSFFTAADALVVLDRIGPLMGLDISREGFYRLAHMLSADATLNEGGAVDPRLRGILGLEPDISPPPLEKEESRTETEHTPAKEDARGSPPYNDKDASANKPLSSLLYQIDSQLFRIPWLQLFGPAEACAAVQPSFQEVRSWTAELNQAENLLPRVLTILTKLAGSVNELLDRGGGKPNWAEKMIYATAWQESCFRQFIVKDEKITYLLSYNNTSVGIMQINEKVWRGIYDLQGLRWNIEYNSNAGAEILNLYLNRYIAKQQNLKKISSAAEKRYLAAWLYALYNGGPAQLNKFPERNKTGKLYKSERLFLEKYDKVADKHWLSQVDCLPSR